MKLRKSLFLIIFFLLLSVLNGYADSPVWKITKGDQTLFIGGTVHLLTQADYPLPQPFEDAYLKASKIVFETDIKETQTPEFQKALMQQVVYPEGTTLKTTLDAATYEAFENFLTSRGIPKDNIIKFKAGMASVTLTVIELQRLGLIGTGVDEFFSLRALNDQKQMGALETIDEQIAFIAEMGQGKENELIAYTLDQIGELPDLMASMKAAWRNGDNAKMGELGLMPLKKDFPNMYDQLIVKRNNAWMPEIEAMVQNPDIELILVGALHLVGEDGLLAQLEAKGYRIEQQ